MSKDKIKYFQATTLKENEIDVMLDDLVAQAQKDIMTWNIHNIYLLKYALEHHSIERAIDRGKEIFDHEPSRDALNRMSEQVSKYLGGPPLYIKRHGEIEPTKEGKEFINKMNIVVYEFCKSIHKLRVDCGKRFKIAATQFMMVPVTEIYSEWDKIVGKDGHIDLELIRTAEVSSKLLTREVDLVFSGCIEDESGKQDIPEGLEFQPISDGGVPAGILTNMKAPEIKTVDDFQELSNRVYFILPEKGVMHEFADELQRLFPEIEERQIKKCNDIFFGISILQSDAKYNECDDGCMLILKGAADWTQGIWNKPSGSKKRKLVFRTLPNGFFHKTVRVGLFRRKEDAILVEKHPLQICWKVFHDYFRHYNKT